MVQKHSLHLPEGKRENLDFKEDGEDGTRSGNNV